MAQVSDHKAQGVPDIPQDQDVDKPSPSGVTILYPSFGYEIRLAKLEGMVREIKTIMNKLETELVDLREGKNFHVWNEAWISRFDLPNGYGGWQALDPTPMDCSEGVVTCGPSPVVAILKGDLYLGFETKYLFAELHGGRVHWQVDADGNMEPFIGGRSVGGAISTKCVGTISRDDLTSKYKYPEGSKEEAQVLEKAGRLCYRRAPVLTKVVKEYVTFNLEGGPEKGGDIKATLRVEIMITKFGFKKIPSNELTVHATS